MIELKNINVVFKRKDEEVHAVNNVSLEICKGDIYGIVGFSGAGKSTLVRTINLLQKPTSGEVLINNKNLIELSKKELREERKNIGMIFQHFNLMNSRTVYENVIYPLKGSKLSKKEIEEKAIKLLELVEIKEKKDSYPSELSGGQKQRVAIARALANDPEILLCDEATSALDPQITVSILKLLKKINKSLGVTIILITHEMQAVKEICNKVAIMDKGEIIERGSLVEIFAKPQKELTKNFINTANNTINILEKLKEHLNEEDFNEDYRLVKLSYIGDSAEEPLIINIYEKFNVSTNILYGNIEYLGDTPFGNLIVINKGKSEDINRAYKYLEEEKTLVERLI